ncbi:hypothetical protein BJY04DRAFT_219528 [Aspergillus karnatakaensis]|uniref:uncharacterized protein n=1 Tax=Aspergillus karnatakaensis TaxID=1810916 RepID=UPI003CCD54A8
MSSVEDSNTPRVSRVRRSDETDSYVILNVLRKANTPEMMITATEGESPYTETVHFSQLRKLRAKGYHGTDDEWRDIVLYALGLSEGLGVTSETLTGVEASATINGSGEDDKELVITIRKRIQTITRKLGTIILHQDDEQGIELFEWFNIAIARADTLEKRVESLLARSRKAEDTIKSLNDQLEEFISSKKSDEQQLMSDFVQLLNEKKLKIRNQQRLLASASVDPEKLSTLQAATSADNSMANARVRALKRSATRNIDGSESEDGFEELDVEKDKQLPDDKIDEDGRATPQPIEDSDNTTTDDESPARSVEFWKEDDRLKQRAPRQVVTKSPPPKRALPFTRKSQRASAPATRARQDSDEMGGETDDDEL